MRVCRVRESGDDFVRSDLERISGLLVVSFSFGLQYTLVHSQNESLHLSPLSERTTFTVEESLFNFLQPV